MAACRIVGVVPAAAVVVAGRVVMAVLAAAAAIQMVFTAIFATVGPAIRLAIGLAVFVTGRFSGLAGEGLGAHAQGGGE